MATFDDKGFITALDSDEIIIVGTNDNGFHGGGAAHQAYEQFGAMIGEARGMLGGQSYGIATLDRSMEKLRIAEIREQVQHLVMVAILNLSTKFYLTPIGTGIAGFTRQEIADLLDEFTLPDNVIKPKGF